jgi:bifunctional enzyme Fae/Hps
MILSRKQKYLQIALNSDLSEARKIIAQLPFSERVLIEVGTPLIKIYGKRAILEIKNAALPGSYIVADIKCVDLALRDVKMAVEVGAQAVTCLGVAPIETIDRFIEECKRQGIDSMIDMMNVSDPVSVLKKLKTFPMLLFCTEGSMKPNFQKKNRFPFIR